MERSHILVIDDEPSVCNGCRLALSDIGYSADICNSGSAGLDALLNGQYDLALLDVKLPDIRRKSCPGPPTQRAV